MKAVILYDPGGPHWDKKDVAQVAESAEDIRDCLKVKGFQVSLLPIRLGDFSWIPKARKADVIFNLCEGLDGHSKYEDFVVGTLELVGVPYTGCRQWPVTICHRKHIANTLMEAAGVPIPRSVMAHSNSRIPMDFPLPAIVKPAAEQRPGQPVADLGLHQPPQPQEAARRAAGAVGRGPDPAVRAGAGVQRRVRRQGSAPDVGDLLRQHAGRELADPDLCRQVG